MRAGKTTLRGQRQAIRRLLIVDAFEDKIVAEDEPIARGPQRAGESTVNRGDRDVHCDFRGRGDLHFEFHAWLSFWDRRSRWPARYRAHSRGFASGDSPLYLGSMSLLASTAHPG